MTTTTTTMSEPGVRTLQHRVAGAERVGAGDRFSYVTNPATGVTSRWLDPSHGGINLGLPQTV